MIDRKYIPDRFLRSLSGLVDVVLVFFLIYKFTSENIYQQDIFLIYFVVIPLLTNGQTVGQFIFGFKLVSLVHKELTFFQLMSRQVLSIYLSLIFFLGEVLKIMPFLSESDQLPQDILLQTLVIRKSLVKEFYKNKSFEKKNNAYFIGIGISTFILFYSFTLHF